MLRGGLLGRGRNENNVRGGENNVNNRNERNRVNFEDHERDDNHIEEEKRMDPLQEREANVEERRERERLIGDNIDFVQGSLLAREAETISEEEENQQIPQEPDITNTVRLANRKTDLQIQGPLSRNNYDTDLLDEEGISNERGNLERKNTFELINEAPEDDEIKDLDFEEAHGSFLLFPNFLGTVINKILTHNFAHKSQLSMIREADSYQEKSSYQDKSNLSTNSMVSKKRGFQKTKDSGFEEEKHHKTNVFRLSKFMKASEIKAIDEKESRESSFDEGLLLNIDTDGTKNTEKNLFSKNLEETVVLRRCPSLRRTKSVPRLSQNLNYASPEEQHNQSMLELMQPNSFINSSFNFQNS